jgi:prephenate dehydratase
MRPPSPTILSLIENIFEIDIKMNLLVRPGTKASDISKIISHQQALKQCRMYLKRKVVERKRLHNKSRGYITIQVAELLAC